MAIEKYTIEKDRNSMAGMSAYETTDNGGPGSGNFGHSGRPGKVGGSSSDGARGITRETAEKEGGKTAADKIYDDPKGKYSDGFDTLERASEFLADHVGEGIIGEEISLKYEDDLRDFLGIPSIDEESQGANVSTAEYAQLQEALADHVRERGLKELSEQTVGEALDCALRQGGVEYALAESKLGQAGLSHDDALRDLEKFIVDFGLTDHYGAIKAAESGDFKTAWRDISYDLVDSIDDEYGRAFGREFHKRIDK